jgi:putative transcriptional regulator
MLFNHQSILESLGMNNQEPDDYSKRIKAIRQQLGLSQEELAHKLGVSFTSVNRWENGQTKPSKLAKKQIDLLSKKTEKLKDLVGVENGN